MSAMTIFPIVCTKGYFLVIIYASRGKALSSSTSPVY